MRPEVAALDRVIAWNARVGRDPLHIVAAVRAFMALDPDVIVLLEARTYSRALRRAFRGDWRIVWLRSDVVALVRRDLPKPRAKVLRHLVDWLGPKALIQHRGRRHLRLRLGDDRLLLVHRVPGGPTGGIVTRGANRRAWDRESRILEKAARRGKRALCVGDQNCTTAEFEWPGEFDVWPTGSKVDWAWGRGYELTTRRLARRGSDHPAVLYTLRRPDA